MKVTSYWKRDTFGFTTLLHITILTVQVLSASIYHHCYGHTLCVTILNVAFSFDFYPRGP